MSHSSHCHSPGHETISEQELRCASHCFPNEKADARLTVGQDYSAFAGQELYFPENGIILQENCRKKSVLELLKSFPVS